MMAFVFCRSERLLFVIPNEVRNLLSARATNTVPVSSRRPLFI